MASCGGGRGAFIVWQKQAKASSTTSITGIAIPYEFPRRGWLAWPMQQSAPASTGRFNETYASFDSYSHGSWCSSLASITASTAQHWTWSWLLHSPKDSPASLTSGFSCLWSGVRPTGKMIVGPTLFIWRWSWCRCRCLWRTWKSGRPGTFGTFAMASCCPMMGSRTADDPCWCRRMAD